MNLSGILLRSTIVAALGGLLFGFDTAVIAGITDALTRTYKLDPNGLGLTVAAALAGTITGAMLAGFPGEWVGRRDSLRVMALLYVVSSMGCALAWNWSSLVAFRFVGGLGIGGSSVVGPMYIAEIAPAKWRGRLVGFFQFNVVAGILLAYFSNYVIGTFDLGESEWRWKLGVSAAPAGLFLLMLYFIPRSPRWLVSKGRLPEAGLVLRLMGEMDIDAEISRMRATVDLDQSHGAEPLFIRRYRLPVFLAITIGMFNQLSGINAILYYLNDIFARAGFTKVSSDLQSVAIGATNLLFTLLAMSMIDRLGRRILLLTGSIGTAICLSGVATGLCFRRPRKSAGLAARRLYRFLRVFAGRGYLGLHQRSVPNSRARQGAKSGQLYPLGHECAHFVDIPHSRRPFPSRAVCLLRSDDGSAVCRRADGLP